MVGRTCHGAHIDSNKGTTVMTDKIVAYIGKPCGDGIGVDRFGSTSRRYLTQWDGTKFGYCSLSKGWPVRSYVGSRMYQVHAQIGSRFYTGRSFGEGMAVVLRETAESK